jgi:hypothetical protein
MDQPGGFTNDHHRNAYKIAKHLSERKAEDKTEISAISLELVRDVGPQRFAKIVMFYVDQINRSPAAKNAGPGFLHGGTVGIEDGYRLLIRATYDRLKREALEAFYAFLLEHLPADVIVWGCLYNTDDQEAALEDELLVRTKPGEKKIKRDIARVKDRSLHLDRTIDGNSESDNEHPSLGPMVDLDALEESSESNQDGGDEEDQDEEPEKNRRRNRKKAKRDDEEDAEGEESSGSVEPLTDRQVFHSKVVDRLTKPKGQVVRAHSFDIDLVECGGPEEIDEDDDFNLEEMQPKPKKIDEEKPRAQKKARPPAPRKRPLPMRAVKSRKISYQESESSSEEWPSDSLGEEQREEDADFVL